MFIQPNILRLSFVSRAKKKMLTLFYKTLRGRTTETFRAKTNGHGTIRTNNEINNFLIQT